MKRFASGLLLALTACSVGPDYVPPEECVSEVWSSDNPHFLSDDLLVKWWEQFEDPLLDNLVNQALECNYDLLTAASNILQARALRQIAAASFFPMIGADVNATRTYFSKNGPVFAIGPSVGSMPGTVSNATGLPFVLEIPQVQNLYNALFDATWEIDLFGKTRRRVEAADAIVERTIENRNQVMISVLAELASNYIELRAFQRQAQLIEENIALLEKKSGLASKQLAAGYISRLDDESIKATLAQEKAKLPQMQAQIYRNIYTISVLIGAPPEALVEELSQVGHLPKIPESIAVGLRSDLLRRRPDVRAAERNLAAATANIGVAVAEFFPTFTLIGDGGFQSLMVKNLFTMASKTWAYGGDVMMPLFQGGRLKGNLLAKKAETAAAASTYQKTVLTALEEAEGGLVTYSQDLATLDAKSEATQSLAKIAFLSQKRFDKGLVSLENTLDTKRDLNQSEQALLESHLTTLVDLISLYKILGGGWQNEE